MAVPFGLSMLVNIGWPRAEIYDLDGQGWYFRWSAPISMVVIIGLGLVALRVLAGQRAAV